MWYLDVSGETLDDALIARAFTSLWDTFVTHVVPAHSNSEWDSCRATFYWDGGRVIVEPDRRESRRGLPVAVCSLVIEPFREWAQSLIFSNRADTVVEREVDAMLRRCCGILVDTARRRRVSDVLGPHRSLVQCCTPEDDTPFQSFTL